MGKVLNSLGALATTGTVGTGGYFLTTTYILPLFANDSDPTFSTLNGDSYEDGTIGKIYGKYLLGSGKENQQKWKTMYDKNLNLLSIQGISSSVFSDATTTSQFSNDRTSNTALNKQCESKYKSKLKQNNEEESGAIDPTKEKGEWQALWIMCSPWNPTWLKSEELENKDDSIGKSKIHELLSTSGAENDLLWQSKNADFFSLSASPAEGIFKTLWESKGKPDSQNLKTTCANAYKLKAQDNGNPTPDEVVKYCSMMPII